MTGVSRRIEIFLRRRRVQARTCKLARTRFRRARVSYPWHRSAPCLPTCLLPCRLPCFACLLAWRSLPPPSPAPAPQPPSRHVLLVPLYYPHLLDSACSFCFAAPRRTCAQSRSHPLSVSPPSCHTPLSPSSRLSARRSYDARCEICLRYLRWENVDCFERLRRAVFVGCKGASQFCFITIRFRH